MILSIVKSSTITPQKLRIERGLARCAKLLLVEIEDGLSQFSFLSSDASSSRPDLLIFLLSSYKVCRFVYLQTVSYDVSLADEDDNSATGKNYDSLT